MNKVKLALEELKKGNLIIVADDDNREAEGDFVGIAEYATSESINTMVKFGRGLVCVPMSGCVAEKLNLNLMTNENTDAFTTAFTISVDHISTKTGISAAERAFTIQKLADKNAIASDFSRPGHIFPLLANKGGVISRRGHTEAAVDLARLSGASPVAYICEILNEDGTMKRLTDLKEFAKHMNMVFITVEDIANYRYSINDSVVKNEVSVDLPTDYGTFLLSAFSSTKDSKTQLVLSKGDLTIGVPLIRLHSECITGDVFSSHKCDCGEQLDLSLSMIKEKGALLYLRQEGRGIGIINKLRAYKLQAKGIDTYNANLELNFLPDEREYGIAAAILHEMNVKKIRLLTNNPDKVSSLEKFGIEIVERVPLEIPPKKENFNYLKTKKEKFDHILSID